MTSIRSIGSAQKRRIARMTILVLAFMVCITAASAGRASSFRATVTLLLSVATEGVLCRGPRVSHASAG